MLRAINHASRKVHIVTREEEGGGEHARLEGVSSVGKSSAKAVKIFQYLMAESHGNVDKEKK